MKVKHPNLYNKIKPLYLAYYSNVNPHLYNILEHLYRYNHHDLFTIFEKNIKVQFFLPHKNDDIQQKIIVKRTFYENELLNAVGKYLHCGSIVIDVGANIGNHTVFFGKIANVQKVYCFEPNKTAFDILKLNVELNDLNTKTELYNIALGSENGKAEIDYNGMLRNNLGNTSIIKNDHGKIEIKMLDDIDIIEGKVDLIKIDVEGFEIEVLKGSLGTLKKYRPIVWVESFDTKYAEVNNILLENGYALQQKLLGPNYLFAFA